MINVGFVGCGRIADLHALGYRGHPDARIYAVCDTDAALCEKRRKEWGAEAAYTDHRSLLDDPKLDAVEVLVPYDYHEQIVLDAVRAGKHIACQKPMSNTLASADRMVSAAAASEKVYRLTEIYVWYPPIMKARELIDAGAIGEPVGMRINYLATPKGGWEVPARTYEQQVRIASTGLGLETFDHGHHEWATAWYLLGEAERVSAWVDTLNGVVDGPATIMWKCRGNKRYGVADFMFAPDLHMPSKYYSNDEIYQVIGTRGVIMINRGTGDMMDRPPVSLFDGDKWTHFEEVEGDWAQGFAGATHNFIRAIKGEEAPFLTGEEGREVLRFGLAVTASAAKRREVYLDELDHPWPWWLRVRNKRRDSRDCPVGPRRKSLLPFGRDLSKHAAEAHQLTMRLPERFDGAAISDWECTIALELLGEGGVETRCYGLFVRDGALEVQPDALPEAPNLTLHLKAGLWAGMLLGKKRIETAVLQGQIKYEGKVEQALPLREALHI